MPELPEVETAARQLRAAAEGKRIRKLDLLHPSLQRRVSKAQVGRIRGKRIERVERRGKHQLIHLDNGDVVHVHFRMAGDWIVASEAGDPPRHARAIFTLDDDSVVALVDPRALSTIAIHRADALPDLGLGPEPDDPAFTAAALGRALAARRSAVKPALLDQRVVAGVGNIYAAEALWRARIDPFAPAASLSRAQLGRLVRGIRAALRSGMRRPGRYAYDEEAERLEVYGREDEPCRRCGTPIARATQAGRSTYWCPRCQPDE